MLPGLIFYFLVAILVPMVIVFNAVQQMQKGKERIERTSHNDRRVLENLSESYRFFLEKNKFVFYGSFKYKNVNLAFWEQNAPDESQRFFILLQQFMPEFVTQFNEEVGLTTSGHASAFMYPRPYGAFLQSKKTKNIDRLWQYHKEGEEFLVEECSIEVTQSLTVKIEDRISQWMVKQGTYISRIPFFWIRAPYWFYIKRFIMLNVSIRQQITKRK
jgi:hypothetical protein